MNVWILLSLDHYFMETSQQSTRSCLFKERRNRNIWLSARILAFVKNLYTNHLGKSYNSHILSHLWMYMHASLWLRQQRICLQWGGTGSVPGLGRSPGGGHGESSLENPHGQRNGLQSMGSQRVGQDWDTKPCTCVLSCFSRVWLCDPMGCILPGCSVLGILQTRKLEWLPCPPPGDLPKPGIEPACLMFPALAGRFFTTSAPGKPHLWIEKYKVVDL